MARSLLPLGPPQGFLPKPSAISGRAIKLALPKSYAYFELGTFQSTIFEPMMKEAGFKVISLEGNPTCLVEKAAIDIWRLSDSFYTIDAHCDVTNKRLFSDPLVTEFASKWTKEPFLRKCRFSCIMRY